jgi:putative transposase
MRHMGMHIKGDERILGDAEFVESIVHAAGEKFKHQDKYHFSARGYDFDDVVNRVSKLFDMPADMILTPSRAVDRAAARRVVAYWALTVLEMPGTEIGRKLTLSQSAVSRAVRRGEEWVRWHGVGVEIE